MATLIDRKTLTKHGTDMPLSASADSGSASAASRHVDAINRGLQAAWDYGIAARPSLAPTALIGKAARRAKTGPDSDGCGWRARLDCLCADLRTHAQLTPLGRTLAHGQLVGALVSRFRAHALWERYPEIADIAISAPIIIVGQMRSGSTRMHRLLATDPRLTYTRFYESWNPLRSANTVQGPDERKLKAWLGLRCAHLLNPAFKAIHPTSCTAPDEEIGLHNLSIFGTAFEAQWSVPNFTKLVEDDDGVAVYREFKHLLRTLRWFRKDKSDKPWILKVPQFAQDLPALLQTFPDARVIFLTRDLDQVLASNVSLVANQRALQSHRADMSGIQAEWARKVSYRESRMAEARQSVRMPHISVDYDDVSRNWESEMRRVYAFLELDLDDAVKERMGRYLQDSLAKLRHAGKASYPIGKDCLATSQV